jgi:ACR3 family arsenite efflux pump ArsB
VSERPVPPMRLWWLAAGFSIWCSALVALYALHAIGCAFGWSAGSLRLGLAMVLLAHLVVMVWMWRDIARAGTDPDFGSTRRFLHGAVTWTLIAALVASVLTLGPPLLLTVCM